MKKYSNIIAKTQNSPRRSEVRKNKKLVYTATLCRQEGPGRCVWLCAATYNKRHPHPTQNKSEGLTNKPPGKKRRVPPPGCPKDGGYKKEGVGKYTYAGAVRSSLFACECRDKRERGDAKFGKI